MIIDEKHVKIHGCFVVWDGITRPDTGPDNKPKYSLKVVVNPNSPDLAEFQQLANASLQQSKFKGVLPQGGRMPVGQAMPTEFNGMFNGWAVLNCNSQRLPDVYDENGQRLDPLQYGQLLYGGQQVDTLVHCYEYDKAGNRGIATGLDAFAIIVSANAPRQNFGGAGIDTSAAFGGAPAQQPAQQVPAQQVPAQGQQPYQQPAQGQQPYQQPAQQAPAGNVAGNAGQGQPGTQASAAGATTSPSSQQPQQAHNFLPPQ